MSEGKHMAPNLIGHQQPPLKIYVPPSELMTKVLALLDGAKENWLDAIG